MRKLQIDFAEMKRLVEVEKWQHWRIAEHFGIHQCSVERWCKRLGLETQRTGPRGGDQHPEWKGGRLLVKGYWHVWAPEHPNAVRGGKYMAEHRLVMEKKLGRYLLRSEVVHHRDGNPENNDPENLEVFQTNADHLRHELTGRVPNWTEDGKRRIREGQKRRRKREKQARLDAQPNTRTNARKRA